MRLVQEETQQEVPGEGKGGGGGGGRGRGGGQDVFPSRGKKG